MIDVSFGKLVQDGTSASTKKEVWEVFWEEETIGILGGIGRGSLISIEPSLWWDRFISADCWSQVFGQMIEMEGDNRYSEGKVVIIPLATGSKFIWVFEMMGKIEVDNILANDLREWFNYWCKKVVSEFGDNAGMRIRF